MGILGKKVYRDLMRNKGRSLSIIFIIMVSSALYGGLLLMYINATASFDNLDNESRMESVRYSLNDFVNIENLSLSQFDEIDKWDYRISTITTLRVENNSDDTYTAPIFGVETKNRPKVNDFHMETGSFISGDNDINIITQFAEAQELKLGDDVYLDAPMGRKAYQLVGTMTSPEYIYSVNPITGLPDLQGLAAVWIPIDTLRQDFGLPAATVNEILVRFKPGVDDGGLVHQIKKEIAKIAPLVSYTLFKDEGEQVMKEGDVGLLDDFARIFGIIILLLALFIMYDSISKMIQSQRNYIGTMRALGGGKAKIVMHYTMLSAVLSIIGVVLGIPLGYELGNVMVEEYASILGIPTPANDFHISPFYESITIHLILVLGISLLSSIGAARIEPREAMASGFITMLFSKKPILEKITSRIRGLNSPSMTIPLRMMFRFKRRTTLTILTYGISMVLMMSSLGFMDSFSYALDMNYQDIQKYDMEVHFIKPILPEKITDELAKISDIHEFEMFSTSVGELVKDRQNKSISVEGFPDNPDLRSFDLISGDMDGLVLGSIIAKNFSIDVGETVEFYNRTYKVSGIAKELLGEKAFLPLTELQDILGIGKNVTSVMILAKEGVDHKKLKNELIDSNLPVAIVISNDQVKTSIETMIQGLFGMIAVMILIGFATIALFSFNTIVLDVMSREQEFINLRTLGGNGRKILKVIAVQAIFISIIGSIIAVPISYYTSVWMMDSLIGDLMVLPVVIKTESYAAGIFSAIIASLIGVFSAWRRMMKLKLEDATRNRVSN